jgi:site-specific recombinase XerD
MASLRKRGKVWHYRYVDADGRQRERKGCTDKRETERMAIAAETKAARIREGTLEPEALDQAAARRKPIREHLNEFIKALTAKGKDPKHVRLTEKYAARVLDLGEITQIADLKAEKVLAALESLRIKGSLRQSKKDPTTVVPYSARTLNAHLTAIKSFSYWLVETQRCPNNRLAPLRRLRFNEKADRRLVRRPLSDTELRTLIEKTRGAPAWRGMSGPDRCMLYMIGAATGFRRSELASLRPESFHLCDTPPTITCEAAYAKNGKQAIQPVSQELANTLKPWLAAKRPHRSVFERMPEKTGQMLKADLKRAKIEAVNDRGHVVDMHSLRHGYITALAKGGVNLATLTQLARHSDPKLTFGTYTHLEMDDKAAALGVLPDLTAPPREPEPQAIAADASEDESIYDQPYTTSLPYICPTRGTLMGGSCRSLTQTSMKRLSTRNQPKTSPETA